MADEPRYQTRYFNARTGEVELTCCTRCGAILWNPALHEETYHAQQDSGEAEDTTDQAGGTGQENSEHVGVENPSEKPGLSEVGVSSGRDRDTSARGSGSAGIRAGRSTQAGSGKQGRH